MKKTIVIASDHAGFDLKDDLVKYYQDRGDEVIDLGATNAKDAVNYADFGHQLADYYLQHKDKITYGIGVCGTGLGIGYALNRHNHIVAARVTSVEDAQLAKMHNNANFLTFGGRQIPTPKAIQMIEKYEATTFEGGRHLKRISALDQDEKC